MKTYKIGDIVRLRNDLDGLEDVSGMVFTPEMKKLKNIDLKNIDVEIVNIKSHQFCDLYYGVKGFTFFISYDMIDHEETERINKIKNKEEIKMSEIKIMENPMYKKGDVVRLRNDLSYIGKYQNIGFAQDMEYLKGEDLKISGITVYGDGDKAYSIENDIYVITDDMIDHKTQNKRETVIEEFTYERTRMSFTKTDVKTGVQEHNSFMIPEKKSKFIFNKNAVICLLKSQYGNIKGVAKCDPNDEYDKNKGLRIAYNRAKIKLMQRELKDLTK